MEVDVTRMDSSLAGELYFLIAKFLSEGPCRSVADALKSELERAKILPQRLDWEGNEHNQSFQELERAYSHISPQHLLQICSRIGPVLEKEVPPCVPGAVSLLGAGRQSLLRTKEDMDRFFRNISSFSSRFGGKPLLNPPAHTKPHNFVKILQGRENSGPLSRRDAIPPSFYSKLQLYRHTLGHLSAVYCVLYDRTGQYIITGADDLLVKVWSSTDGRLLATFRGASAEIMDIAVNFDNTLLAAGSLDKILRVWCFQTMSPIAVLSGHSGMITSLNFCPVACNGTNYLVSTSSDGSVAFWAHSKKENERVVFQPKPIQYHEKMRPGQAQMICASFSPGGVFVAAGSADHHVRVYMMVGEEGPKRVLEVEAHSDTVDSIQWAHSGLKFISGSKDGTANIWNFEQQQWQSKILIMTTKLAGDVEPEDDSNKKTKVTMVCWDVSDEWVVTAVNDTSLKVWNSKTAELVRVLRGHKDEVFVLESHPIDPRIILSAGHDGQLIVWDVLDNKPLACFQNFIDGQGNGAVFDAKWSPDGTMLAATDSHGHLLMYGFRSNASQKLKIIPKELFFHTDYRPLIRDANNYVLDEQTQTAPHLMPPPFLVDVDGNPYPPTLQRLVPGRENCRGDELVPNIAVGASGQQEVIEGIPQPEQDGQPRSNIDRLIEQLAQRQRLQPDEVNAPVNVVDDDNEEDDAPSGRQAASPRAGRAGLRREGDVEGVRQSSGNWQRDNTTPWNKPILVRPLKPALLSTMVDHVNAVADAELENYKREMRKRPQVDSAALQEQNTNLARNRRNRTRHGYRTRAAREEEQEEEFENPEDSGSSATTNDSSSNEEPSSDSSSDDTSSEYSDWVADHGEALEPPKRSKRKPVQKRPATPPSDSDRRRSQRPKKKDVHVAPEPSSEITEVPEIYRPPEWLSEVEPKRAPYYPQMGDEIVYFRQGHKKYLDAVKAHKIYEVNKSCEPWSKLNLKAQEFVKVIGIKYEIRPPRLCCLKLAQMDANGHMTDESFTIKYHDVPNVIDFLVLRQTYDLALQRSWTEGDRFRCIIEDGWWMGKIISFEPCEEEFPDSYFLCFKIQWDNGEPELMSPWDLEPIDETRLPEEVGGAIAVLPEEIQETLYQPKPDEWPMGDRDDTCQRIIRGLDQVMTLAIAEPFIAPVDLNIYPAYAYQIEYPIDLSTIKARFENRFYRRILAAQFDVRYLATNAEKFNERHSQIVKQARIITDICLKIIRDDTECDVTAVYHDMVDAYHSSDSSVADEVDVEVDIDRPSTSSQRPRRSTARKATAKSQLISSDWRVACRQILQELWQCEDSVPFREPVDSLEFPNYTQVIDTPMDLQTVKEELLGGNYESPTDFAKDVRLIFTNSKNFNTNQRSKIYSMTVRLSSRFEELIRQVINRWKSASRLRDSAKKSNSASQNKSRTRSRVTNGTPKKTPAKKKAVISDDDDTSDDNEEPPLENDDDEDVEEFANGDEDDDDEENCSEDSSPKKRVTRQINFDEPGPSTVTNGHSKRYVNSGQRSARSRNAKRKFDSNSEDDTDNDDNDATASSSNFSDDSNSRTMTRTRSGRLTTATMNGHDSDSDYNYQPSTRGKQTRNSRAKNSKKTRPNRTARKGLLIKDDDEDEDHEEEEEKDKDENYEVEQDDNDEIVSNNVRYNRRLGARNVIHDTSDEEAEEDYAQENTEDTQEDDENDFTEVEVGMPEPQDNYDEAEEDNDETASSTNESTENILDDVVAAHSYARSSKRKYSESNSESNGGLNVKHNPRRSACKRTRYNEDTDDDDDDDDENFCENSQDSMPSSRSARRRTVRKSYNYNEVSDEDSRENNEGNKNIGVSVSSRGRVRKMTARAQEAKAMGMR